MNINTNKINRRSFLENTAAISMFGALGLSAFVSACSSDNSKSNKGSFELAGEVEFLDKAPDGKPLKAGLIGCGGRGTGAAINFLNAGPNLSITALGDIFADKMQGCREKLKTENNVEVPDENCFIGFDAFQKVIDSGVDVVILATPPYFRPQHFEAAVQAGKHIFFEKPVAVDPVGARSIMASGKKAEQLGLCIVTGTQRHHQRDYVNTYQQVKAGAIGEIVSGNCYWNQGKLWHVNPQAGWSEMEAMLRDWVNWCWLSGDHISEQHIHNIDVVNWFKGKHPIKAVGFGSKMRRPTGNQFDFFSVDFVYDDNTHLHSMSRQIDGCANNVSEFVQGTKGSSNCQNKIFAADGSVLWEYKYPLGDDGQPTTEVKISPYDQEHIDLVTAIRSGKVINEAQSIAESTMVAIMGRISAYTGKETTWDEMMNSDLKLGPKVFDMGKVDVDKTVPVAGEASQEA